MLASGTSKQVDELVQDEAGRHWIETYKSPVQLNGDSCVADFHEGGQLVGRFTLPLPGLHNLSNATGALAACRLQGVPFADLSEALASLQAPGRRFDYRGTWQGRQVVDDYAHHPSEVAATLAMARLMVSSGRSPLPCPPKRLVAVFQPHRYTRTAQFLQGFARCGQFGAVDHIGRA